MPSAGTRSGTWVLFKVRHLNVTMIGNWETLSPSMAPPKKCITRDFICFTYGCRWNRDSEWEASHLSADLDWKKIVEPVMQLYTETTDGSNIEIKESALVWHHQDADPDFGSCQAKELLDHLESVLANEPAIVTRGQHIVEVKPQVIFEFLLLIFLNLKLRL